MNFILESAGAQRLDPWVVADADNSSRSVKSAERTLALFELFSLHQTPLSIGDLARLLAIPQPSVSMLVRNLAKLGYLEHDRTTRTYLPTIRIMLLGSWIHRLFSRDQGIEAHLDALMSATGETVSLGIQNGVYSQYVSAQMPSEPGRMEVQSGLLRPITCTAAGRILLSLKSDSEVDLLVRRCNTEVAEERLKVNPIQFKAMMASVRARGYAETRGDMTPGYSGIGVSVPAKVGRIPMALCIGGPTDRIIEKQSLILDALMRCKAKFEGYEPTVA